MLNLFVIDGVSGEKLPAMVTSATDEDLQSTSNWQTHWITKAALKMPNKVSLRLAPNGELLGLMSYAFNKQAMAIEIIYLESARHSNANMLHTKGERRKYIGIAKALFAYAADISMSAGFDGVLIFKAKTGELLEYYIREFGARQVGSYDPFRLVIWEDAAERIISDFRRDTDG